MENNEMLMKVNPVRIKIEDRTDYVVESMRGKYENTIRAYKTGTGNIAIQARTYAPLNRHGRKSHDMLLHAELTKDEAQELIDALIALTVQQ